MFAKLAQSLGFGRRHPAAAAPIAVHCNDNHPVRGFAPISQRAPRCVLAVWGWRRTPHGSRPAANDVFVVEQLRWYEEAAGVDEPAGKLDNVG